MSCLREFILGAVFGLVIGFGVGAVLGFVRFSLGEKFLSSPGLFALVPSGALRVGMLGAILMGILGSAIGLITGLLRLRPPYAAAVGILIIALIKRRAAFSELASLTKAIPDCLKGRSRRRSILMNIINVTLFIDIALIGVLVAVLLRYWNK